MELDRASAVPVARQILDLIRDQIARGELRPGDRLPTEMELCARLGVSRKPVRQALGQLTAEGLLVRQPRRGTFVSTGAGRVRQLSPQQLRVGVLDRRWLEPLRRAESRWNALHPEQPVALTFQAFELARLRTDLSLLVAQGRAPDISVIDSVWVPEFAERGYIHPLDAIAPDLTSALAADLFAALRRQSSAHGHLYALPAEVDLALLWYRKDWFAAQELPPPRTWDDWLACARLFQHPAVRGQYGIGLFPLAFVGGLAAGETTTYQLLPLLWAGGADVIADQAVVLDSPAARRTLTFVRDLVQTYRVAAPSVTLLPWDGAALALAGGQVAMALGGSYEGELIRRAAGWDATTFAERLGFVPIPAGPGGGAATLAGGISYVVYRQSRCPRLALDVLAQAMKPAELARFSQETGQNPPTRAAARALRAPEGSFLAATARLMAAARPRWPIVEYARVSAQLARMFEDVILDRLRPDAAVARAAAVIAGITGLPEHPGGDDAAVRGAIDDG